MVLKVAVVGTGGIAKHSHLPALAKLENIELVAFCDLVVERVKPLAQQYGVKAYTDLEEMLDKEKPQVAVVLTREHERAPATIKCLEAGAHVFCEKALSDFLEPAEQMVQAAERCQRFLGVNFNYRFSPPFVKLRELVDEGQVGEICFINSVTHGDCYHHMLDMMRYFGGEVVNVLAHIEMEPGKGYRLAEWFYTASKNKAVILEFESGAVGTVIGSDYLSYHHPMLNFTVVGTKAQAHVHDIVDDLTFYPHDADAIHWRPNFLARKDFNITFEASVAAFMGAMNKNQPPPVTGLDALRVLQIEYAIMRSSKKKIAIKPY